MSNDVEHLTKCLFVIHISSLLKYLYKSFLHFLIKLFAFLLSFKSSLYNLTTSHLSYVCFANIC